ncbi:MAG: HAMP domain-containing histidine kinase [Proteobacteria bacterium]|nr:MAG: HAMP domain-containing histidine kinase [Pseudomonadota bacterium]
MRLTEFITANHESIVEEWVEFAGTLLPWAEDMDAVGLRDHAVELLAAVVEDMNSPQTQSEQSEKSRGNATDGELAKVGQAHALDRLESGISLKQLVSEFRALRASVHRKWEDSQSDLGGEVTRFNESIDEALVKSIARYSETVNTTREQFLAILGHDLRNPIGAILMAGGLLTELEGREDAEIARSIVNSAERMSRMVNDLLDLTRTRLGSGIPVSLHPMQLTAVCQQTVRELQVMHPKAILKFYPTGDLSGEWDRDRLAQTVSNLLANAKQYGDISQPITVAATGKEDRIIITVHNEGPPIPHNAMKTIFAPMARHMPGAQKSDTNVSGLGLGLFIASEIVSAHGGTLRVESTGKKGTTFEFVLPRHPAPRSKRNIRIH